VQKHKVRNDELLGGIRDFSHIHPVAYPKVDIVDVQPFLVPDSAVDHFWGDIEPNHSLEVRRKREG
jgi:hypothetical protein